MVGFDITEKFKNAYSRLVLLDYDGTLVDYAPMPLKATPSNHLLEILEKLLNKPQTKVMVITGRKQQDIDKFLGHLPIDIIAEHGAISKENGKWKTKTNDDCSWKNDVLPLLNKITLTCPDSFVEEKHFSLSWHYRNTESSSGHVHSRELIHLLQNVINSNNLKIIDGNKVVEVMTLHTSKGQAIQYLIEPGGYDCILCIGDDRTDEDMFEYLLNNTDAITVKIGPGQTLAKHRLGTVHEAIQLLEQLSI